MHNKIGFLMALSLAACSGSQFSGEGQKRSQVLDARPAATGSSENAVTTSSETPQGSINASADPSVLHVNMDSCVRNAACSLQGNEPGKYSAVVKTAKSSYSAGEVIEMSFSGMPGFGTDWITVVPAGIEDNSWCPWFWSSKQGGTHKFNGLPEGKYELRAYYRWTGHPGTGGECEVIARSTFTVSK